MMRLRIARGYSVYELAAAAGVLACAIQGLEAGKAVDKRVLAVLAPALGVRLCRLVFGDQDALIERACAWYGAACATIPAEALECLHQRWALYRARLLADREGSFRYAGGMELAERTLAWLRGGDPETGGAEHIGEFRRLLEAEMRPGRYGDHPVFREWLRRADLGPDALANALLDCTERGRYMRSMAPLRAFVSRDERFEILRGVAREHGYEELPVRRSTNAE